MTTSTDGLRSTYRLADLTLDAARRCVLRQGRPIELKALDFDLLHFLVESAPNIASADVLAEKVWGRHFVSPENVAQRVMLLRQSLADDANRPRYIETVRNKGYRLIPVVEPLAEAETGRLPWRRGLVMSAAALLLVALATTASYWFPGTAERPPPLPSSVAALPFENFTISELTISGNAVHPAISPDGRYVVYAQREAGDPPRTSLWVRQVATSSNAQIVPAEPGVLVFAPTVTPDGNFVDYVRREGADPRRALWRVPLLGGTARPLVENVWSPIGWSPDGRQMAFVRRLVNTSELVVADADGGRERVLATRNPPAWFLNLGLVTQPPVRPAWSPDGSVIALLELRGYATPVVVVDAATGAETIRDSGGGALAQGLAWLGPSSLLLSQPEDPGQRIQLWRMSYPDARISRLTNDLSSYIGVSVDGARDSLVTSRRDVRISLWAGDAAGKNGAEVVLPTLFGGSLSQLSWAGERLLYNTTVGGRTAVAAVVPGRGAPQEVVANALQGTATSDGGTIVFFRGGEGLWRVDSAGRQPVQLVTGNAIGPLIVPGDRHVVFVSARSGVQSPWIVPLAGGEPTEIVRMNAGDIDVSADGLRLLFPSWDERRLFLVVCDLPACANRRELEWPANASIGTALWSPDGQGIAYVDTSGTNLWRLPLDGGPPSQITRFGDAAAARGPIARFAWSRDGERLAVLRQAITEDIVLLRGLPP